MSGAPDRTLDLRAARTAASGTTLADTRVPPAPPEERLVGREEALEVRFRTPDGESLRATVISRVMGAQEQARVGQLCALLAGGPWDHLPSAFQSRIVGIALVATQLRSIPDWLDDWMQRDAELLAQLVEFCEWHSGRWLHGEPSAGASAKGEPRVAVIAAHPSYPNPLVHRGDHAGPIGSGATEDPGDDHA